jgi:hypothetical protein
MQFCGARAAILILESVRYFGSSEAMMADPTGESAGAALKLDFDRRLRLRFARLRAPPVPA